MPPPDVVPIPFTARAHAVASTVACIVRPRRPRAAELAAITWAPLPRARATVSVRALAHTTRQVPALLIEGRLRGRLPMGYASYLVEHPSARLLVDPGIASDVDPVIAAVPTPLRQLIRPPEAPLATVVALSQAGIQPDAVDLALPTHLHWDHVSGLLDLPNLPVLTHRAEWEWAMGPGPAPSGGIRPALRGRPVTTVELGGPPVLTFPRSHDVLGDGSIILVDLAGHTPGSVGVLLHTEDGWVLLIGDTAWLGEQLTDGRQKLGVPGEWVDADREATWTALLRVRAARHRVRVVPAHDPACLGHADDD